MTAQRRRATPFAMGVLMTVAIGACTDPPAAPTRIHGEPTAVALSTPVICEKNWLYMKDGNWGDPGNWLPSGVPTITDDVCISGVGSYSIALDVDAFADSVFIGPGVAVTFVNAPERYIEVHKEFVVAPTANVTFSDSTSIRADAIINGGSVVLRDRAGVHGYHRLENNGYLELATLGEHEVRTFVNTGDIRLEGTSTMWCNELVELAGGRILGAGSLLLANAWPGWPVNLQVALVWSGTVLGARGADSNPAQIAIYGLELTLSNTTLVGAMDLTSSYLRIYGDIGPNVSLKLGRSRREITTLTPLPGSPSGTPVVNHGRLLIEPATSSASGEQLLAGDILFENRGALVLRGTRANIVTTAFDNRGTVSVQGELELGSILGPTVTRNLGVIDVALGSTLIQKAGSFLQTSVAPQTGRFRLEGGVLTGGGHVGNVEAVGGAIAPGPGLQTLTLDRLVLGPNASVQLEVARVTTMDRLQVLGEATYDGLLEVTSMAGYVGGTCGQLLPMITDRNSLTAHAPGRFRTFANLPAAVGRAWRAHYATDSVLVAGYDPRAVITTTRSTSQLTEGGAASTGHVCLGVPVTSGKVGAALNAVRGQFTSSPAGMSFTSSNFALPQPVSYMAVDDARSEGPHGDTLTFTLTSGGAPFGSAPPRIPFDIADNDPAVDLAITIVSAPTSVPVGQNVDTRFRITNVGPGASTGSTVEIPVLSGLTYVSGGAGTSCTLSAGTVSCSVGALAAGASADVLVLFNAPTVGTWNNTIRVRGNDWDNVSANDAVGWLLSAY